MAGDHSKLIKALHIGREHRLPPGKVIIVVAFAWRLGWQADRRRFVVVLVSGLVQSLGLGAGLLALRGLLGGGPLTGTGRVELSTVVGGLLAMIVIGLATSGTGLISSMLQQVLILKINALAGDRVAAAVAAADLRAFEDARFHDRVEQAVWAAQSFASQLVATTILAVTTVLRLLGVIGAVVVMAWWLLPVLLAATVPAVRVALHRQRGDFALRLSLLENRRLRDYLMHLLTGRDTAKEVRAFDLADLLRGRLAAHHDTAIRAEHRFARMFLSREIRARLAGALVLAGVVAAVVVLINTGRITVATAIAALGGAYLLSGHLASVAGLSGVMGSPMLFVDALRGFLEAAPPRAAAPARAFPFTTLSAEHVMFTYPGTGTPALQDVCLELPAGQMIAVVGPNGSGKTTLAKILTGLYRPDRGTLRWDGTPVEDPTFLRAVSAVLFQDFVRYKFTGADNIGFGRPGNIDDHHGIRQASRAAGAHDFLTHLPFAYETVLSTEFSDGVDLSTGQWQRIALARAYFRDAPFVVLDEPTAALDSRAEANLLHHVRTLYSGRTVLLITHRLATARHADHIYVLDHGRIVEHGTHTDLVSRAGAYANLFHTEANRVGTGG